MTEIHNEILFYNLADTPPIDDATPILIDNENANSITIINTSVAGVVFVNNVPLYPFGSGRNAITFRGNENEILATKIGVVAIKTIGNIDFGFCVVRKIYKHGNNKTSVQNRFFDNNQQPSNKKRLR